jgi:hypothetical protein
LIVVLAAVAAAIAYLVSKIPGWIQGSKLTIKQQEALIDVMKKANGVMIEQASLIEDLDGTYKRYYENQLALTQAAGLDQYKQFALRKQIAKEEQQIAQQEVNQLGATNKHQAELSSSLADLNNKRNEALRIAKELGSIPKKDLTSDQERDLKAANDNFDFYSKIYDAQKELYDAGQAARTKLSSAIQKQGQIDYEQEKFTNEEIAKIVLQTEKIKVDAVLQKNQLILSNEASTRDQRIAAEKAILQAQLAAIDAEEAAKLKDPGLTARGRQQVQNDAANDRVKLTVDTEEKVRQIIVDYAKRDREARASIYQLERDDKIKNDRLIIDSDKETYEKRRQFLLEEYNLRRQIIGSQLTLQLSQEGLTSEQRKAIIKKGNSEYLDAERQYQQERLDLINQENEKNRVARAQQLQAQLSDQVKADEAIIENEKTGYAKRLDALLDAYTNRKQIIGSQLFDELADQALTDEQRKAIVARANSELLDEQRNYESKYRQIVKDNQAKILSDAATFYDLRQSQVTKDQTDALVALNERFRNGKISVQAYENERAAIEKKGAIESLQIQVAKDYNVVNSYKEGTKERIDAEAKLAADVAKLSDAVTETQIQKIKKVVDAYKDAAGAIQEAIFAVVEGGFESQKNAIQGQIDLIAKQKQDSIDAENASGDAAQDKADKIATINAKAQADTERLQLRQKQLDIQKAKFEKARSIATIIERTAMAIMSALSEYPPNIPLSVLAGVTGAAQLAAVIATPIPQYKAGTPEGGHPGGLAITGDGGRPEPIILPGGRVIMSPDTSTLMDLPKGTIVMPSIEEMIARAEARVIRPIPVYNGQVADNGSSKVAAEMRTGLRRLEQAINNKPVAVIHNTYAGVQVSFHSAQSRHEWINRNMQS